MANRDVSSRSSKHTSSSSSSQVQLHVCGVPFALNKELLAARSALVASLLKENPHKNLSYLLRDIPADPETFELVARFCHGFEVNLSTENVIPISCLAYYLEMSEHHSKNNLLNKALSFFEQSVFPSWNEIIKAFRSAGCFLQQAVELGFLEACLDSLVDKVLADPRLLGEPIKNSAYCANSEGEDEEYRPNARRRLFVMDWKSEDLTTLPLQLYEPIIRSMNQHGVLSQYVAASICQYVKKWVFSLGTGSETVSIYNKNSERDVIEAVERIMPNEKGLVPSTLLFEMLRSAISLEASHDCRNGLESRIGKQLEQAKVKDLLIPCQGYAKEVQYDIECFKRILRHFYSNYANADSSGLISVAKLVEDFLLEVSRDRDLNTETFIALAETSKAASIEMTRNYDGIYKAIDVYLDKHSYLTELEKEEVCKVLDCNKMSPGACEHAAKNGKLPMRFVVQVLFAMQLQLRDTFVREVHVFDDKLRREDQLVVDREEENGVKAGFDEEEVRADMERMSIKVMELEKECKVTMKEIENESSNNQIKKAKGNMWRELKRKFGCGRNIQDCNCQVKKKKKKKVQPRH